MGSLCLCFIIAIWTPIRAQEATCPGTINLAGYGPVSLIPTGWGDKDAGKIEVVNGQEIIIHMGGRVYFANACTAGAYNHSQYLAPNLLGKKLRYTTDMSGAGCGCNAAFYLVSMRQNTQKSKCNDYYCDANSVCGVSCAEVDIQEANQFAWHSTLHTQHDHGGVGKGEGGGAHSFTAADFSPGGKCINTQAPFEVEVAFPVDNQGNLKAMELKLMQQGSPCPLAIRVDQYDGMAEVSQALAAGMAPVASYWKSDDMLWMDKGPCQTDNAAACPDTIKFSGFSLENMDGSVNQPTIPVHNPCQPAAACNNVNQPLEPSATIPVTPNPVAASPTAMSPIAIVPNVQSYPIPPHWHPATDPNGNMYYWNDATREVTWEFPLQIVANYLTSGPLRKADASHPARWLLIVTTMFVVFSIVLTTLLATVWFRVRLRRSAQAAEYDNSSLVLYEHVTAQECHDAMATTLQLAKEDERVERV